MRGWLRDFVTALHFGVPHEGPDWEALKVVEDRIGRVEEDVEALRMTVEALAWRRRPSANNGEHQLY